MHQNESYKIYIRPPIGSNVILCSSKEKLGIQLKKEYDRFRTDYVACIEGIQVYPSDPVEYFIDHVHVTPIHKS